VLFRSRAALALLAGSPQAGDGAAANALLQLSTQLALARGDTRQAQALLAPMAGDHSRTALLLRAQVAVAGGDAAELRRSVEDLQIWVSERPLDASAWQLLALCADRLGLPLRAIRAEAEAQTALGNLPGAIDRLRAGQQMARRGGAGTDFIEASVIDARLRALLAQRRQLLDEQRDPRGGQRGEPPPE
jgi:predicted Zn-dependent protease